MNQAPNPEAQLAAFLAKYTPEIATQARAVRARLQQSFPGGIEFVYDNYNALVIGYGPSERVSEAVLSIAVYPRWITLFFLHGAGLDDPQQLLKGRGKQVRNVRLGEPDDLLLPAVQTLIALAIAPTQAAFTSAAALRTVIKSISARQRSRRPHAVDK